MKDHGTPTHDFASVTDFNNLYQSFTEARKGKRWKYSVCKYEANVLENLLFIQVMLQRHKYRLSPYNCFFVHEPKERLIMYNSFRDKTFSIVYVNRSLNRFFRRHSSMTTMRVRRAKGPISALTD